MIRHMPLADAAMPAPIVDVAARCDVYAAAITFDARSYHTTYLMFWLLWRRVARHYAAIDGCRHAAACLFWSLMIDIAIDWLIDDI